MEEKVRICEKARFFATGKSDIQKYSPRNGAGIFMAMIYHG